MRVAAADLRALARQHPTLTEPESRERLARWLVDEEDPVKKLDPEGSVALNLRIPAPLWTELEHERQRLALATPGMDPSMSDVVRVLLARALAPAARKRSTKAKR